MKVICISGVAQSGKDLTAYLLRDKLKAYGNRVLITHYADLVKYVAGMFFNWNGEKDEYGRGLLQKIGTDIVRTKRPTYWIDFIISILDLFDNTWDYVLIPDARFPNECDSLIEHGFDTYTVRVERPNFKSTLTEKQKNHPSETAMDDYIFDYIVTNDGTVEDLEYEVLKLVKEIRNGV